MHWYVYHSRNTMGHAYSNAEARVVYSSKLQPKLCLGDTVWVVEGDECSPANFALVDTFLVRSTDVPSRVGPYTKFKLQVSGGESLLKCSVPLTSKLSWFESLHSRYITKQRFFMSLTAEPDIESGFRQVASDAI